MLELGAVQEPAHREAGRQAAECGVDVLIAYGPLARLAAEQAAAQGVRTVCAATHREAAQALLEHAGPGDAVLAKASRSMQLEKALELFYAIRGAG